MTILPALFSQEHDDTGHDGHEFLTNGDVNDHSQVLTTKTTDNGVTQTKSVFNRIPRPKTSASLGKPTLVGSLQQLDRRPSNAEELRNGSSRRNLQPRPATCQVTHRGRNDITKKRTNMSMGELPPIGKRPGSGTTSKLSSRGSSKELLKGSVIKYERRNLISVDNLSNDNGRFSKSLGSEESSAWSKDRDSSSNINSTTDDKPGSQRGSQSNSISQGPNKLSTLFETNGTSPTGPSTPVLHEENHFPSPRNSQTQVRASSNERRLAPSKRTASMKSLVSDRSLQSKSTAGLSDRRRLLTNRRNSEFDFSGSVSGKATSRSYLGRRTPSVPSLSQNVTNGDTSITQSQSQKPGERAYRNSQSKILNNDNETQSRPKTNKRSHQSKSKPSDKDEDEGDTDAEKEKRIWDWLASIIGAEKPPSPIIFDEEPAQTDTSIHIVYDGDEQ